METILAALTAMILGAPITFGAILTNQQDKLCEMLGGTYRPAPHGVNVCPGGQWSDFWKGISAGRPGRS